MIAGELLSGHAAMPNSVPGLVMRQGKMACRFAGLLPDEWISL